MHMVMSAAPPTLGHRSWRSFLRFAFSVQVTRSLAVLAYAATTPSGPHRRALLAIASAAFVLGIAGIAWSPWIADHAWRSSFWCGWTEVTCVLMGVTAWLDGGVDSPLVLLPVLPVLLTVLVLSPRDVLICTAVALATLIGLILVDARAKREPAAGTWMVFGGATLTVWAALHWERLARREERLFADLRRYADIDRLTGCHNQRSFRARLAEETVRAQSYGRPLSVLVVDVDGFTSFNDTFGQARGDQLLASVGLALRAVSGVSNIAGRTGEEEFAMVLPETTATQAAKFATGIASCFDGADGTTPWLNVGVAELDGADALPLGFLGRADQALRDAKRTQSGHVAVAVG